MKKFFKNWFASGEPWIWMNAAAVGISIVAIVGILALIAAKGFAHFWPSEVLEITYEDADGQTQVVYAEAVESERISTQQFLESGGNPRWAEGQPDTMLRTLYKSGNRKHNAPDFRWIFEAQLQQVELPEDVVVIERVEWGNAYGRLDELALHSGIDKPDQIEAFHAAVERANEIRVQIDELEGGVLNHINYQLERLRLEQRGIELRGADAANPRLAEIATEVAALRADYLVHEADLRELYAELSRDESWIRTADGQRIEMNVSEILSFWQPNVMSGMDRFSHGISAVWRFLTEDPREANTEGGIFPAIFGTVLMVLLMSVIVTPFGVIAAIYLREYAKQGFLVRTIRIAVNNLAGVPSIVYGVFGLGFFVYFLGGNLDRLFYPEALPSPTFGTPGLVWASLTLALLTVPVVIVSTEEGLTRIPRSLREGSLALGATKSETLFKVILPMASPSILTGVILAVARAAGEVAPLMLVGVVKLAPTLPLDGNFPYLHLERKFMHLGFHIYDVGFQSPNVDAARPLVYATALLLVTIIVALNLTAITLRSRLERRYRGVES